MANPWASYTPSAGRCSGWYERRGSGGGGRRAQGVLRWEGRDIVAVRKGHASEHPRTAARSEAEAEALREEHGILVLRKPPGAPLPTPIATPEEAPFASRATAGLRGAGLPPMAVQAWPAVVRGHDLAVVHEVSDGKTATYALPMLNHVLSQQELRPGEGPIGVVLLPGRGACLQVATEIQGFADGTGVTCRALDAGDGEGKPAWQPDRVEQVDIAVATPGELVALLNSRATNLCRATFIVIDEADGHAAGGLCGQLRLLLGKARPDRQVMLFTEAWLTEVEALARDICTEWPIYLSICAAPLVVRRDVDQRMQPVAAENKQEVLCLALDAIRCKLCSDSTALVFCNNASTVEALAASLQQRGYPCASLHGQMGPQTRGAVAQGPTAPAAGEWLLVCTHLLGRWRGLATVQCVINYDIPTTTSEYAQHLGRFASEGPAYALTLYTDAESHLARALTKALQRSAPAPIKQAVPDAEFWHGRGRGRRHEFLTECGWFGRSRLRGE